MWHFGRDGLTEYTGEKFCVTVQDAGNILARVYAKDFGNGKIRIRDESQECPNKSVVNCINERIS